MFNVLIADDEYLMRKALSIEISNIMGFQVVGAAENGDEAIKLSQELTPDIVLIDLRMPGIDGLEASERIKRRNPQTEIILITAYQDFESARKCIDIGISKYLLKPFWVDEIRELLQSYAQSYMKKIVLHDALIKSVISKRFLESYGLIGGLVNKLFLTYKSNSERYSGFKLLFTDLFGLIPGIHNNYISLYEKKHAISDSVYNDRMKTGLWLFDIIDEVYRQRSIQMYDYLVKVFNYIDNTNKEIVLSEAANYVNLSMSYLSRIFSKEMGVSFSNYINIKKIRRAKQIMGCSDLPVNEIAFNVGFNEPNYFCKVFKKFERITPTQYRGS